MTKIINLKNRAAVVRSSQKATFYHIAVTMNPRIAKSWELNYFLRKSQKPILQNARVTKSSTPKKTIFCHTVVLQNAMFYQTVALQNAIVTKSTTPKKTIFYPIVVLKVILCIITYLFMLGVERKYEFSKTEKKNLKIKLTKKNMKIKKIFEDNPWPF